MAYSNWGAFVFCNGKRRKDKEDVIAFDVDDAEKQRQNDQHIDIGSHAVLGDKEIRLCAYKTYPRLWRLKEGKVEKIDIEPFLIDTASTEDDVEEFANYEGEVEGFKFTAHRYEERRMIDLTLTEPDGTGWISTCGLSYGAGYMD